MRVSTEEVVELLRKVGNGAVTPKLADHERTCTSVFCGNVEYVVDGWIVVVFIDCNDWDYVDSVVAPDGRKGEFEDWFGDKDKDGNCECRQPDDLLNAEDSACYLRMVDAFEEAT